MREARDLWGPKNYGINFFINPLCTVNIRSVLATLRALGFTLFTGPSLRCPFFPPSLPIFSPDLFIPLQTGPLNTANAWVWEAV